MPRVVNPRPGSFHHEAVTEHKVVCPHLSLSFAPTMRSPFYPSQNDEATFNWKPVNLLAPVFEPLLSVHQKLQVHVRDSEKPLAHSKMNSDEEPLC